MVIIITVQSHGSFQQQPAKEQSPWCSASAQKNDAWRFANKALPPWKALTSLNRRPRSWTNFLPTVPLVLGLIDLRTLIPSYHFSFMAFVLPPSRPEVPCYFVVLPKSSFSPQVFTHPFLWDTTSSVPSTQVTRKHSPFIPLCFSKGTAT